METIKNCPFCGARSDIMVRQNMAGNLYIYIQCSGCRAQSHGFRVGGVAESTQEEAQDKAIGAWNRREPQSEEP